MIEIKELSFSYGDKKVLENISLQLHKGRIYGLLGENGVGKTTLLTLICGLKKPSSGKIVICGYDPYDRLPSMLSEQYFLSDDIAPVNMRASDYADCYGSFWRKFDKEKFYQIMRMFEMDSRQYMNRMSAGQLKKTYIAFAFACNAGYLYLDEPTNGLDIPSKAQFRKALMKYTGEETTVLISTHQVRDLENVIDPIIILNGNEVLLNASLEEITSKLYFDYGAETRQDALYRELIPGGNIQVCANSTGEDSKVNIEALFNAVHAHKEFIKAMF